MKAPVYLEVTPDDLAVLERVLREAKGQAEMALDGRLYPHSAQEWTARKRITGDLLGQVKANAETAR